MSSELNSAANICRGKVSSSKQQLLNKFSSNYAPSQYGVDYSTIGKQDSSSNKNRIPESKNLEVTSSTITQNVSNSENKVPKVIPISANQKRSSTFKTVSSIKFQTSPPVKRKVILITSNKKENLPHKMTDYKCTETSPVNAERKTSDVDDPSIINEDTPQTKKTSELNSDKDNSRLSNNKPNQPPLQLLDSEPDFSNNYPNKKRFSDNKSNDSRAIVEDKNKTMKSDFVDTTLVSVAQRAKSIMVNRPNRSTARNVTKNATTVKPEDEENEEPILSIKDRIKIFKENVNQTASPIKTEKTMKTHSSRFKTQPLSFDDIARANAMILDQNEVGSTIASPSITNSNETLVDISEDSSSSTTNTFSSNLKSIARVQSCLLNKTPNFQRSIDEEDLKSAISVKDIVKSRDKETETIVSPKLSRNPAVSRRLAFKNKTFTEEKSDSTNKVYGKRTHLTQPITKLDLEDSNMSRNESNQTINDRISSIQSDENKWKLRVPKNPGDLPNARPGSLYEIQEQLQTNQTNWKTRVELKDVEQFTTQAKMLSINKNSALRHSFHGSAFKDNNHENIFVTRLFKSDIADQNPPKVALRSNFVPTIEDNAPVPVVSNDAASKVIDNRSLCTTTTRDSNQPVTSHKVSIPQMSDQSLSNFFNSSDPASKDSNVADDKPTSDDFDEIFLQSDHNLAFQKRSIKPTRRTKAASKNPIKKLNERSDIIDEYEEVIYGIADRELTRCQVENIQQKAGYAEEALAALSSKEDFSKVKLKRTESGKIFEHFVSPYKDLMLISVKGRRKVQLRLVKPAASSINCGDCYLLVTGSQVFVWQGFCANVIEINKANELGSWIAKCKDLNYKGNADKPIIVKSNDNATNANVVQFWSSLKYDCVQHYNNPGAVDEDELYEQRIQTTNMVYEVVGNELIPMDEYWGRPLKYQILADNKVFIFDFGSELYLWSGNKSDNLTKTHGRTLLRQLWAKGFDYEACTLNPLDPLPESPEKAESKKGLLRPDWVIVGRLPQKGETTLFKEKFSDWPESSRLIKVDNSIFTNLEKKSSASDLQPIDLDQVLATPHPSVHLTIDGKSVGRGSYWKVIEDGILREFEVLTKKLDVWHIVDNDIVKVDEKSMGQFCNSDSYIIRWDFELKTLGRFKRNQSTGNLSSAFFFWQGSYTTVTEKTASALHTIDLDKDKVTQIRVKQHDESPAFCRLFDSAMIIHQGKRKIVNQNLSESRLFVLRGEIKGEGHFVEVQCQAESLRARCCFMLLNVRTGNGYLWFGRLSSEQSRLCAQYCVERLNKRKPTELGLSSTVDIVLEELNQGKEHRQFWNDIVAVKRWRSWNSSAKLEPIRGWLVSGVTNSFELSELRYSLNPDPGEEFIPSFPLVQSTLYKASQPALFIIWNRSRLYLWQGWWPHFTKSTTSESDYDVEDEEIDHDWSIPKNRIAAEKLAALKTLNSYLIKHSPEEVTASIIYAGLEPLTFQELFPFWEVNETVKMANIKKGYQNYQEDDIQQTLNKYLSEKFSVSRLQMRPLPECVVLSKIEWYLADQEFENLFKMSKEEFYEMTPWKQREKKKEVNLF